MTETYEQLRDSATGEAGVAWKAADHEESNLRALYRELREDPRYTNAHKAEQAWEKYEAAKERIASGKTKAREVLETQAHTAERQSVPFPSGEGPITSSNEKLLISQNEASRIVRKLDRMDTGAKGPLKPSKVDALREEYGRGLEVSGVQGGSICRGVLSACDEFGIDVNSVVDSFRTPRHREALERAQRATQLTQYISKRVPEPPFKKPNPAGVQRASEGRSKNPFKRPGEALPLSVRDQRHW